MPDTVRTLSALQTLLADNTSGDISPQDVRDMLVSVYQLDYSADTSITTTATATIGKWHICTGTTSDYTVTLPAVSGNAGQLIGLRMSSALTKLVTIDGNGAETIDGATTRVMWANEVAVLFCDGTGWTKIAGKTIPMSALIFPTATELMTHNTFQQVSLGSAFLNVGGIADTANSKIKLRRIGNYLCVGNFVIENVSSGSGTLITVVKQNANRYRVARLATYSTNTFSGAGSIVLAASAGDDIILEGYYYDSGLLDRYTEYTNPDSRCYLSVTELPEW